MAEITASMVKSLREETGQGMMECKKALEETKGDIEAARDLLRARGQVKAEKKAARATHEGLVEILVTPDNKSATMVEVACETDFCARNDVFRNMVSKVVAMAAAAQPGPVLPSDEIKQSVQDVLSQIGENMNYVRGVKLVGDQVGVYKHHNNKVGVIVAVEGNVDSTILSEVCMHIAFHAPMGIDRTSIPADVIEKEKAIAKAQAMEQGKPEAIAEKMVVGKVNKFYEDNCLLEQLFIKDDTKKVKEVIGSAKIIGFARYSVGELVSAAAATE